jgi:general secretion pathway protein D
MMTKQHCSHGGYNWIFAVTAALLIFNNCLFAAEQTGVPKEAGYKIFPLKHISVEQGKKYLAEVMTGTVTHFPASSALLVTAEPRELTKAKAILDLVDGPEKFVVKAILPVSAARNMPSNEQIAAKLNPSLTRGISIGSFSNPPGLNASTKAIIDIHNDAVIAVAPARLLEKIVSVVGKLQNSDRLEAQEIPKAQDKPESPAKRKASALAEPSEARFIFTASGEVKTEPNTAAAVVEQETPEPSVDNQDEDTPRFVDEEQIVNLALAERQKLTVVEFLGLVGPYLQLDFMYEEKDVADEVTINPHGKFRGPIKVKDLYPLLEDVLKFKNLAMTRGKGNLVTIAPVANALDIDPALLETQEDKIERGDGIVQRVFKLEHIDTITAQNLLTGMKLTTSITAIPETKTLILTGYSHRMARIQALLNIVDRPGEPRKFRFRQLQYTMAETLAPKLQSLAEQLGTLSITIAETSAPDTTPARVSPKRANETAQQYQLRVRQAEQAAARARAGVRTPTTAQQPDTAQPTVYLDADERTNRILMIGLDKQLEEVEELISTLDVVQQDLRSLELYKINHVDAEDVKKQLEELGIISPSLTSPYSSSRITSGAKPPTTPQTTAAARQPTLSRTQRDEYSEAPTEEPQVIVVEPTNSLLVNATAEQHVEIAEILSYVDAETDKSEIRYKIYPLENQSPEHLVTVLEPLIQESVLDKEGKVESVRQKQEEQITIVPDPNTFSLVVYASKKNQEWLSTLIEQLDERRSQVLIDVTLVQINKDDDFTYDLDIISSLPSLTETAGLTGAIMGDLVSTFNGTERDRFIDFRSNPGNENPLERGKAFYGDRQINLLLKAMQEKSYGRVLAKPKILVNDNEAGTISSIDRTYVTKTSSIPVSSGGAGGNATLIQTAVDYKDYPAGITLSIVPHISRGDFLRLNITLDRSDFDERTITGEKPPDTTESNIETTVTVPDGCTIILGGLLKLDQSKGGTKVPILGDIPLVGGLFRSTSNRDSRRNLYVFVKAEIIRPPDKDLAQTDDHLDQISRRNREAFEDHEREFQEYNDWPGIKPKPVEPFNVLDTQ